MNPAWARRYIPRAFALYKQNCEASFDEACKQAERLRKTGSVNAK